MRCRVTESAENGAGPQTSHAEALQGPGLQALALALPKWRQVSSQAPGEQQHLNGEGSWCV